MKAQVSEIQGAKVIAFEGDIDLETSPQARVVLLKTLKGARKTVVDLSMVPYMDSSGIASLIEAYQKARAAGGDFALAAINESTLRAIKLARLDRIFTIYDTVDDAVIGGAGE